ncbi:E3 ubiquitin-protein ligase PRT1-like [Rutidosis leptorrhynchoides]|uniref:E3 ubiquitin-protein ligase PRT1-like n=1 Tax=Rutidosis leptorrhynchoides TaxID=125765 RepID=UPI003A999D2F
MKNAQLLFPVLYAFVTNTPDTDPATIAATAADHATRASAIADTNATVASTNAAIASAAAAIATAAVASISTAAATTSTRAAEIATSLADTANTAAVTSTTAANNSTIAAAIALAAAANAISAAAYSSTTASATSTTVATTSTTAAATSASSSATDGESDEYSGDFKCCICLELICKPVVLACGHLSCFWCVFKSMNTRHESRCPLCRHSYHHLPSICWLLHFLLLKLYPEVYQKRETQIMEEEKTSGTFSTQFDRYIALSRSSEPMTSLECTTSDNNCNTNDEVIENLTVEGCNERVSVTDVVCRICKEILYQPVVLNCGHVFCEVCIVGVTNEQCRCPVCQNVHPNGYPKVCCDLDRFLEQHLSEEYNAKKVAINKLSETSEQKIASTVTNGVESSTVSMSEHVSSSGRKVHFGVGCDHCGMYPLVGDRYKCTDCSEEIGFDLCEDCHKISPNLPGKFNQQHTPEHKFAVIILTDNHSEEDDTPVNQTNVGSDVVGPTPTNGTSADHEPENTGLISQADLYQHFFPILVVMVCQLVQFFYADHV